MSKRFSTYIDILEGGDANDLKSSVKNDFTYMLKEFAAWKDKSQWEKKNAVEARGANPNSGLNQQPKATRVAAAEEPVPTSFADKIAARNQRTRGSKTDQALAQAQPQQQLGRQGTIDALQQRNDELEARNSRASDAQVAGTDTTVQALKNNIHLKNPEYLQTELEPQNDPEVQAALGQNQQQAPQQQAPPPEEPPPEEPPPEEPPPEEPPPEEPPPGGGKRGFGDLLKRVATKPFRAANSAINFAADGNINPNASKEHRVAQIQDLAKQAGVDISNAAPAPATQTQGQPEPVAGLKRGEPPTEQQAETPEEAPTKRRKTGGRIPGEISNTPSAIAQRARRLRIKKEKEEEKATKRNRSRQRPKIVKFPGQKTDDTLDAAWNTIEGDIFNEGPKWDGYKRQVKNAAQQTWDTVKAAPGQVGGAITDAGKRHAQTTVDAARGARDYVKATNYNLSQDIPGTLGRGVDNVKSGAAKAVDATHKGLDAASKGAAAVGRGTQAVGGFVNKFDRAADRFAQKMGGTSAPADVSGFVKGTPNQQPINMTGPTWFDQNNYAKLVQAIAADPSAAQNDPLYKTFMQTAKPAEQQALFTAALGVTNNSKT